MKVFCQMQDGKPIRTATVIDGRIQVLAVRIGGSAYSLSRSTDPTVYDGHISYEGTLPIPDLEQEADAMVLSGPITVEMLAEHFGDTWESM